MTSEAWGWLRDPTTGTLRWAKTVKEYPEERSIFEEVMEGLVALRKERLDKAKET